MLSEMEREFWLTADSTSCSRAAYLHLLKDPPVTELELSPVAAAILEAGRAPLRPVPVATYSEGNALNVKLGSATARLQAVPRLRDQIILVNKVPDSLLLEVVRPDDTRWSRLSSAVRPGGFHSSGGFWVHNQFRVLMRYQAPPREIGTSLVSELCRIAKQGPLQSIGKGSPAVGRTLLHALGLPPNGMGARERFGFDIGAMRTGGNSKRNSLFSRRPCWSTGDALSFLRENGYRNESDALVLNQSVYATSESLRGWRLAVSRGDQRIRLLRHSVEKAWWPLDELRAASQKLKNTALVYAEEERGIAAFSYTNALLCYDFNFESYLSLLEEGSACIDLTMSLQHERVRDHGYLFRVDVARLPELFERVEAVRLGD